MELAKEVLKKHWNYDDFRENQLPIVASILSGKDTLALLTTGGGKSICFQVPALMREGICLVVTPLIALMNDQVNVLKSHNIRAEAIYSSQDSSWQESIVQDCIAGNMKFLYLSPEKIQSGEFYAKLRRMNVSMIVVDEAHCVSQWGYDFRPSYLHITKVYDGIGHPQIIALTATATQRTIEDITSRLNMRNAIVHRPSFFKSNLSFQVIHTEQKVDKLLSWIGKMKGSGLIYVNKRKIAMDLVKVLSNRKINSDYYHAGLSMEERMEKQNKWISNANSIMICTNAFGMGIDNPNTSYVIHFNMPNSLEAYFQESGRAGRQGQASHAIVLSSLLDVVELEEAIVSYPSVSDIKALLTLLFNHFEIPFNAGEGCRFEFVAEEFNAKYKLNSIKTSQGIQFLKDNNLIHIADEYYKQDEIQIIVAEDELNDFSETKPDYEVLIKNMIRTYEGLFYRRKVNLNVLAKNYHYNLTELRSMLRNLVKWGIIDYHAATDKSTIEFKISKLPPDNIPFDLAFYRERKKVFVAQTQAVIDYLKNDTDCRNKLLLGYFDEQFERKCGICDHCLTQNSKKVMKDSDYIDIKDRLMENLDNKLFVSIEKLIKLCKPYDQIYVRKVLDRLIELQMIEKGMGEVFKKI